MIKRLKLAAAAFVEAWRDNDETRQRRWPNGDRILELSEADDFYFCGYPVKELREMIRQAEARGELPDWTTPLLEITPLKGKYCPQCTQSLLQCHLAIYSIVPMCRACLDQFMNNGDREICAELMKS